LIVALLKWSAFLVGIFAIAIGLVFSGSLKRTGFHRWVDNYEGSRGYFFRGMMPALHEDAPWGFNLKDIPDLRKYSVLVTGANTGLGYWTAYHLAAKKATVYMVCRNEEKCKKAAAQISVGTGNPPKTVVMDLSSFDSIRKGYNKYLDKLPMLDSLILNAGLMVPPFGLTKDGLERQIGINHFGHFLLTQLLLPKLKAAAKSKGVSTIVSVSSCAHFDSYPEGIFLNISKMNDPYYYQRTKAYGQSKLANVLFAQELSDRVKSDNILVNSVHPGFVETELLRHVHDTLSSISPKLSSLYLDLMTKVAWHPREAALTQIYASIGPDLKQNKITGKYFHPIARLNEPDPHARNMTLQKGLWSLTEEYFQDKQY